MEKRQENDGNNNYKKRKKKNLSIIKFKKRFRRNLKKLPNLWQRLMQRVWHR